MHYQRRGTILHALVRHHEPVGAGLNRLHSRAGGAGPVAQAMAGPIFETSLERPHARAGWKYAFVARKLSAGDARLMYIA